MHDYQSHNKAYQIENDVHVEEAGNDVRGELPADVCEKHEPPELRHVSVTFEATPDARTVTIVLA